MFKLFGFLLLGLLGCMVIVAIFNILSAVQLSLEQFFFHTTWGTIALVCGCLALLFFFVTVKMPQRMRQSRTQVRALTPSLYAASVNESFTNNNIKSTNHMNSEIQEKVIDLEAMSLEGFFREVAFTLNKPTPVIFKAWGIRRLELDAERVRALGRYINDVRGTADNYLKLRADMFFSKEKFEAYVLGNRKQAEGDLDLIDEHYKDAVWDKEYERKLKEADLEDRKISQEERRTAIKEHTARVEFFTMAIQKYPDMPPPLQAYMFTQVHGKYPDAKRDFDIEEKINDYIKKKYEYDLDNMKFDSKKKEEETHTFVEKMKSEREKYK